MHTHFRKHNAKAAAKRIASRFSGVEVIEPKESMHFSAVAGWYPAVKVMDGVLPSSIAPEVIEQAHIELPEGWAVVDGGFIARAETPEDNTYLADAMMVESTGDGIRAVPYDNGDDVSEVDPAEAVLDALLSGVKTGSKEAAVFAMLRQPQGATVAAIAAVMGWAPHTTRAYISVHTRKRGVAAFTEKVEGRGRVYRVGLIEAGKVES